MVVPKPHSRVWILIGSPFLRGGCGQISLGCSGGLETYRIPLRSKKSNSGRCADYHFEWTFPLVFPSFFVVVESLAALSMVFDPLTYVLQSYRAFHQRIPFIFSFLYFSRLQILHLLGLFPLTLLRRVVVPKYSPNILVLESNPAAPLP